MNSFRFNVPQRSCFRHATSPIHDTQYLVIGVKIPSSTALTRAQCAPKRVEIDTVSFRWIQCPNNLKCFSVALVRFKFIRRLCSRLMVDPIIQNFKELKVSKKRSLITRKSINFIYLGFDVVVIVRLLFISSWALRCSMQSVYCSRRILSSLDWTTTSHWPFFCCSSSENLNK